MILFFEQCVIKCESTYKENNKIIYNTYREGCINGMEGQAKISV